MSALKIVFLAGDRQIVLYGQGMKQMWQVEAHVLERLGGEPRLQLETAQFRKFWIDEEGDRVEIMNDVDYEFFLRRVGSHKTPKIYFEARHPSGQNPQEQPQSSTASPQPDRENLNVHSNVECDVCRAVPLYGFRYKCLQCSNFDLCMKCEGEMKHPDHLMLRIPTSDQSVLGSFPLTGIFGNKRRHRKYAAAAAAAAAASGANAGVGVGCGEGAQTEGKFRHRHHRRHCTAGSGAAGLWSNFYDMMQDLAEGGAVPQDSATTETPEGQQEASAQPQSSANDAGVTAAAAATTSAAAATTAAAAAAAAAKAVNAATAAANSQSKETNTSPDRSSAGAQVPPRSTTSAPPSFENLQNLIDPHFMKAGIQILNNFSEMFGKILDPVVTGDGNHSNSAPESVVIDIDLTGESRESATPPPTAAGTPKEAAVTGKATTSTAGSEIITPMETENSPPSPAAPEALPRSRNSQSEENDWTMIDNNVATSTTGEHSPTIVPVAAPVTASQPLDFAKLSQQLQSHIENEMKELSTTPSLTPDAITSPTAPQTPRSVPIAIPIAPVVVPAPVAVPASAPPSVATPAPTLPPSYPSTERRAVAVFHPDPRINSAVHAMTAMGFSNEGAMLTQLLESVNGSIPLALDLMSAAQRN